MQKISPLLIDVSRLVFHTILGRLHTGIDRVSLEYVRVFSNRARALVRFGGRWIVFDAVDSQTVFEMLLDRATGCRQSLVWYLWRGFVFSWRSHPGALVFNTGHTGVERSSYVYQIERGRLRPIFFLHDVIPITHPEFFREGEAIRHRQRLRSMLSSGQGMVVSSLACRDALKVFAEENHLTVPPCVVAPLAAAPLPLPAPDRPLAAPYFVILGTIEPRKNHLLLLHVWRQLVAELGDGAPVLVVVGQRGWECEQVIDLLDRCEPLQSVVIERNRCNDGELSTWLAHAQALLFPTFFEGYGMPLVEALTLGVPVIASDLPIFREIAGVIPEYLDPIDGPGWKKAVIDYMQRDGVRRNDQLLRMDGYTPPTWDQHFEAVDVFVREFGFRSER